jgi:PilZ domain
VRASLVELGGDNSGIVLNISEGGMAILAAEDLDENDLRSLRFQAPEFEHWIEASAEVAWVSDSRKQAGIRFNNLNDTTRIQLRAGISIARTRAKLARQAKQLETAVEVREEVTDATPASLETVVAADSPTPVGSESTQISNQVDTNSFAEQSGGDERVPYSDVREAASDSLLPEAHQEIETKDKVILPEESKKNTPTQLLNSADKKPQKTPALAAGNAGSSPFARSAPLTLQKHPLAGMSSRNLLPNSVVNRPGDAREGILSWTNISNRKWVAVGAIAIVASLLAFLVGWILGDPSRVRLGH